MIVVQHHGQNLSSLPPFPRLFDFFQDKASSCLLEGSAPLKHAFLLGGLHREPEATPCQVGEENVGEGPWQGRDFTTFLAVLRMRRPPEFCVPARATVPKHPHELQIPISIVPNMVCSHGVIGQQNTWPPGVTLG